MALGKYKLYEGERKRYTISYEEWLEDGEQVFSAEYEVQNETDPELVIDANVINDGNVSVTFFVSGGVAGETYEVVITMTTSGGQIRKDEVIYVIGEI